MKLVLSLAGGVLAATVLNTAVLAQAPPQSKPAPPTAPAAPATQAAEPQQVMLVGCIQREADYRQAQDKGRGGVAGTGVGVGDEFVLTNASMAKQGLSPAASPADAAYELTGDNEEKAKAFVGKRVEITGKLKAAAMSPAGTPTGGATAGTPPGGIDVASKDLKLRELEVISVTAATTGTCPAQ